MQHCKVNALECRPAISYYGCEISTVLCEIYLVKLSVFTILYKYSYRLSDTTYTMSCSYGRRHLCISGGSRGDSWDAMEPPF